MTQPPEGRPLFDAGNPHLDTSYKATIDIGKVPTAAGEVGIATIRQGNSTMTLALTRDEAETWAGMFTQMRDMLSSAGLAVPVQAPLVVAQPGQRQ